MNAGGWTEFVFATAPGFAEAALDVTALDFVNCCLRGAGQVMFMNNPLTGAIVIAALLYQSLFSGLMGVVALLASTLTAYALQVDRGAIRSGLFGFNGYLVGLAMGTFDVNIHEQGSVWQFCSLGVVCCLISAFSVIIAIALGNLLAPVYAVPAFTLPFNFAALLFFATAMNSRAFAVPFAQGLLPDSMGAVPWTACLPNVTTDLINATAAAAAEDVDVYEVSWLRVLEAVPKGIGQVYLADNTVSGTAITVGLAICSPTSALMAVLGSVLGTATGLLMQAPLESVYLGLWGYNAVLGCMAIGGMFFYPTKSAFVLASLCAVMCAFVGGALGTMFTPSGLPTLTLPFCLGTLAFALLQDS